MSYKNLYRGEINTPQTVKPFTQSQRYMVFSIISFTDAIVNCPDAVYIWQKKQQKRLEHIVPTGKEPISLLGTYANEHHPQDKEHKRKILTQQHLCTKLRQTYTSYL